MSLVPARRPCNSCPYRRDVPSGVWSEAEYAKLPDYDEPETWAQPPAAFFCHQQDGRLCAGWVAVHDMNESLGLRLATVIYGLEREEVEAILDYETDAPLFDSGAEAAVHGLRELESPSREALVLIARLERKMLVALRRRRLYEDVPGDGLEQTVEQGPATTEAELDEFVERQRRV